MLFRRSLLDFWRTFRRNRLGLLGAFLVLTALIVAVFAPVLTEHQPTDVIRDAADRGLTFAPPTVNPPLGTDDAGRDIWTELIYGARISLTVGFLAGFIAMFVGSFFGITAGYFGGWIDNLLMRTTDVLLVIPDLPLMLVLVATLRQMKLSVSPLAVLVLVIGLLYWTSTARLIRSQVLTIKERQFVARARAIGAGNFHIIRKHILPQIMPLIVANTVLGHLHGHSGGIGSGIPGPGRSHAAFLGHHAELRVRPECDHERGMVVLPSARTGDCVGQPRLCAARQCPGRDAEPAPLGPPPGRGPAHGHDRHGLVSGVNAQPLLSVRHLTTDFVLSDGSIARALEDVSFDVSPGQTVGLVGESGCGKTTTLMSVLRLLPAHGRITAGEVRFKGQDLLSLSEREMRGYRWKEIAIVFQGAMNALNPVMKVGDQIREPILLHDMMDTDQAQRRVGELLELVGIPQSRWDQYPHEYSGGMRQRAMIAMALACAPDLLFADEPTTALDVMIQAQVLGAAAQYPEELWAWRSSWSRTTWEWWPKCATRWW